MVEAVRPIALKDIEDARERIAGTVLRTPLVRLDLGPGGPDIRLKLENLQPTNSYKIRGAANAVGRLERRGAGARRVDGERGQCRPGRRFCGARGRHSLHGGGDRDRAADQARPDGGARRAESFRSPTRSPGRRSPTMTIEGMDGLFIHPFDNHDFIAGHATMGLEILEDAPDARAVIAAIGGGGLITGVGSAIKALRPDIKLFGAEPETAAPYALSRREGGPRRFPGLAGVVRRRRRRPERDGADVGADAAAGRRRDHRLARPDP